MTVEPSLDSAVRESLKISTSISHAVFNLSGKNQKDEIIKCDKRLKSFKEKLREQRREISSVKSLIILSSLDDNIAAMERQIENVNRSSCTMM